MKYDIVSHYHFNLAVKFYITKVKIEKITVSDLNFSTGCPKLKVSIKNFNSDLLIILIYSFLISLYQVDL